MQKSKHSIVLSSLMALLIYIGPNMVQDVHRVFGHHNHPVSFQANSTNQFQNHSEKCPICFFEFNVVDELNTFVYIPVIRVAVSLFAYEYDNQIQKITFQYYNLRAPPEA